MGEQRSCEVPRSGATAERRELNTFVMGEFMWPFKKKEPKPDLIAEAIEDFKSFRDVGETFNYRGIEMIVESHGEFWPYSGFMPLICAAYKNDHGELKHAKFLRRELPALRAENP